MKLINSLPFARWAALGTLIFSGAAQAHDPVFGLGPHVLFKGGVEIAPEVHTAKKGEQRDSELGVEFTYGVTGDWAAGVEIPYVNKALGNTSESGQGDIRLFTKYRFLRIDGPGVQQSMSVAFKLKSDTAENNLGSGTNDGILGLAYGYESRKWYRWAAARYVMNGENAEGLQRGNKLLLDFVVGIRPTQTSYKAPDTVWLLELNGELGQEAELNNISLANTGGDEWFIAPGIFWTKRNFAVKAGVQIPLLSNLNGNQIKSDYRAQLVLEWHM